MERPFPYRELLKTKEPLPEFDPVNPQAKGIILVFHRWPDEDEQRIILEKTKEKGLTKTDEIARIKMWLFKWGEWQKGETAEVLFLDPGLGSNSFTPFPDQETFSVNHEVYL